MENIHAQVKNIISSILIEEDVKTVLPKTQTTIPDNTVPMPVEQKPAIQKNGTVMFDKSTGQPWSVEFSERGFVVDDTRLSFDAVSDALSKEYNIILKKGTGLALDQVKLQKIMKYKNFDFEKTKR